jgi:hypothetical protein
LTAEQTGHAHVHGGLSHERHIGAVTASQKQQQAQYITTACVKTVLQSARSSCLCTSQSPCQGGLHGDEDGFGGGVRGERAQLEQAIRMEEEGNHRVPNAVCTVSSRVGGVTTSFPSRETVSQIFILSLQLPYQQFA